MKVGVRTVQKWRKDPLYISALIERIGSKVKAAIERDTLHDKQRANKPMKDRLDRLTRSAALEAYTVKHWTGPFKSPLDGRTISTPREWEADLSDNDCVPYEWVRLQLEAGAAELDIEIGSALRREGSLQAKLSKKGERK